MAENLSAKNYRRLAEECLRDADRARYFDVREAYEKLAKDWIKLAEESERHYRDCGA